MKKDFLSISGSKMYQDIWRKSWFFVAFKKFLILTLQCFGQNAATQQYVWYFRIDLTWNYKSVVTKWFRNPTVGPLSSTWDEKKTWQFWCDIGHAFLHSISKKWRLKERCSPFFLSWLDWQAGREPPMPNFLGIVTHVR